MRIGAYRQVTGTLVLPEAIVNQCYKWPKPLDFCPDLCKDTYMIKNEMTEVLSLDILALLDGLEADLAAAGIDTDDETEFDEAL